MCLKLLLQKLFCTICYGRSVILTPKIISYPISTKILIFVPFGAHSRFLLKRVYRCYTFKETFYSAVLGHIDVKTMLKIERKRGEIVCGLCVHNPTLEAP